MISRHFLVVLPCFLQHFDDIATFPGRIIFSCCCFYCIYDGGISLSFPVVYNTFPRLLASTIDKNFENPASMDNEQGSSQPGSPAQHHAAPFLNRVNACIKWRFVLGADKLDYIHMLIP